MADVPFDFSKLASPTGLELPRTDSEIIPLPQDGKGSVSWWRDQIEAAKDRLKPQKLDWDRNVRSYRAKTLDTLTTDQVVVPRDFGFVEQKKAQLFFQVPDVHLTPLQPELRSAVRIFQPVVNYYLGEDETNSLAMMNECAFDALCPAGLMCSRIGYEVYTGKPVDLGQQQEPVPPAPPPEEDQPIAPGPNLLDAGGQGAADAAAVQGAMPEMGVGGTPPVSGVGPQEPVPNIIRERYFWERISPAATLIPHNFHGSQYDRAPWLGYRYADDWDVIKLRYGLSATIDKPGSRRGSGDPEDLLLAGESQASRSTLRANTNQCTVTEIWYRCAYMDPQKEQDPEVFYQLVLVDGMDEPAIHRASKLQQRNAQGQLIGLLGNPIHIGSLRYVSDTAYPPSECTISRSTNEELNKSRTQMLLQRDRSTPMRIADLNRIGGEPGLEKFRKNIYQSIIGLPGFDPNNPPIAAVQLSSYPRENFTFNDYLDRDLGEVWAMGANQRGQYTESKLSATEIAKIDQWANTRLDAERRKMLGYFVAGVRKLASLIQLFATDTQYVEILGPNKVKELVAWDKTVIQGKFAFKANPDSAIRIDEAQARTQSLKLYEMLARDPNVNRVELLYEICDHWNLDPATIVIPQLPPKGPDPANVSFRFNAADIDVRNPNFPIYIAILKQAGYNIDQPDPNSGEPSPIQQALQYAKFQSQVLATADMGQGPTALPPEFHQVGMNQPKSNGSGGSEHGGTAPQADHLSKHRAQERGQDRTGRPVQ